MNIKQQQDLVPDAALKAARKAAYDLQEAYDISSSQQATIDYDKAECNLINIFRTLSAENAALRAAQESAYWMTVGLVEDMEKQMRNPSHYQPYSYEKARKFCDENASLYEPAAPAQATAGEVTE